MKKIVLFIFLIFISVSLMAQEKDFEIKDGVLVKYNGIGKNIVIPGGVKTVGEEAFDGAQTLISVTFPKSVETIGYNAFIDCINLEKFVFSEGLKTIEEGAFYNCSGLKSLELPASLEKIGDYAFNYTLSLANISIDEKNTCFSSEDGVLFNKNKSRIVCFPMGKEGKYTVPETVGSIGIDTFNMSKINEIRVSGSLKDIGDSAFENCADLKTVILEEGVEKIGNRVFRGDTALENISLPESLKSVGDYAFEGCVSIKKISLGKNVKSLGDFVFNDCDSLLNILADENNETYMSLEGVLLSKNGEKFVAYPTGRKNEIYNLPSSVKEIKNGAFSTAKYIKSLVFTDKTEKIGDFCFSYMSGLITVKLPVNLSDMGEHSFEGCENLTDVYLSETMLILPAYTFHSCSSLKSIDLKNVKIIDPNAFLLCSSLENIKCDKLEIIYECAFASCEKLRNFVLPETLKCIDSFAFLSCYGLENIYIPESVVKFGQNIFADCPLVMAAVKKNSEAEKYCTENNILKMVK